MDRSSLIVIVMPITALIALFTGITSPFIAGSRSGRSHARRPLASEDARKRIGAAGRTARPPKPGTDDAAPVEYLYVPCVRIGYHGYPAGTRRWVQEVPIVKKTAKVIYYTSDSWDRREAVVSPGCISREEFETDTRCHDDCPRDIAAGYAWEHCPHGQGRCRHGYPAGVIPIPGDRHRPGPRPAILRHPPGRRRPPVPRGTPASRTSRTASTTHQGAAPRHGRRPPRPWRHSRAVHPSAPPVPGGASGRVTVTCPPRWPPADTTARKAALGRLLGTCTDATGLRGGAL